MRQRRQGGQEAANPVLQAAAVLAVGTAAVAFVAGLGTYLYVRFTQHRRGPEGGGPAPASGQRTAREE